MAFTGGQAQHKLCIWFVDFPLDLDLDLFYFISGMTREMVRRTPDHSSVDDISDSHSEDSLGRGRDTD